MSTASYDSNTEHTGSGNFFTLRENAYEHVKQNRRRGHAVAFKTCFAVLAPFLILTAVAAQAQTYQGAHSAQETESHRQRRAVEMDGSEASDRTADVEIFRNGTVLFHSIQQPFNDTATDFSTFDIYAIEQHGLELTLYLNDSIYVPLNGTDRRLAACSYTITSSCPGWPTGATKFNTRSCHPGKCTGWATNTAIQYDTSSTAVVLYPEYDLSGQCERSAGLLGRTLRTSVINSSGSKRETSTYGGSYGRITHKYVVSCSYWGPGWG